MYDITIGVYNIYYFLFFVACRCAEWIIFEQVFKIKCVYNIFYSSGQCRNPNLQRVSENVLKSVTLKYLNKFWNLRKKGNSKKSNGKKSNEKKAWIQKKKKILNKIPSIKLKALD